jgi:hypothetical protein
MGGTKPKLLESNKTSARSIADQSGDLPGGTIVKKKEVMPLAWAQISVEYKVKNDQICGNETCGTYYATKKMVESNRQNERSKEKYHAERGRQTLAIETSKEMDA